ncbi:phosphatidylglycerophosphatase A [Ramlibacter rhizophilus]|uniref:Phosphatidylglycerophosphatase A n=1 Tax=Ramlibacter rhizophilus TaxID=1781167 RepID=A0A4Z0BH92_9BURK|nr:phosphatidylglycerophosphatase A [Ramlibacter rhizophilus]TFY98160.1 phosphatidylglycerophosphatase A [Ramlibacter rhizophilus]
MALDPDLAAPAARPGLAFLFSHPAHAVALGFGAGLAPRAPGTFGTLWGWASFLLLQAWLSPGALAAVILGGFMLGWWACTVTARALGSCDPGAVVWDEVVAFWIVLWLITPAGLGEQLAAFTLFRLLDALKPGPVGWADRLFHGHGWRGGLGVIFDDLVAAFCTLLVFAAWRSAWT